MAVGVGLVTAVVGATLTFRPFSSLNVLVALVAVALVLTGVGVMVGDDRPQSRLVGAAYVVGGVVAVAWPDATTGVLALLVGVLMLLSGLVEVIRGIRGTDPERASAIIEGVASIVFGLLALAWPNITLLVIAVLFGVRTTWFGLRMSWAGARGRRMARSDGGSAGAAGAAGAAGSRAPGDGRPRSGLRRGGRLVGAVATLVVALALGAVSAWLNEGQPVVDEFHTPPDAAPAEPGAVLRVEPFDRTIPDGAEAWRVLYTTTRDEDEPAVASALVITPAAPAEPPPVIAWAHGTTGIASTCAPTVLEDPLGAGAFYALDEVLANGWALVATDYVGLGTEGPHPYLIGQGEARSVLDAVRAAPQLDEVELGDQTVVWGHSQGGNAALWTGVLAPDYAPELDIRGVAALAPASDLPGLVGNLSDIPGGSLFASYVVDAYADVYPDVDLDDYVVGTARAEFDALAGRCLAEPAALLSVLSSLTTDMSIFDGELATGPFLARLEEHTPTGPIPAPLLVGQGETDPLVLPDVQAAWVEQRCADGQAVDFRTYPDRDHVGVVLADSPLIPELVAWTQDRLAGEAPTPNCPGG